MNASGPRHLRRTHRVLADLSCIVASVTVCLLAGKDLNADMLSYHISTAHSFWSGTFRTDFMSAGLQSFLNPAGYLPIYLMIKAGWHSLLTSAIMAALHSIALMAIWRLSFEVLFRDNPLRMLMSVLSTLLAGASPLFIATLGSSFLDPLLAGQVLFGLYLAALGLLAEGRRSSILMLAAGALFGLAAGLKLTAIYFCVAAGMAVMICSGAKRRIESSAVCIAGMAIGFALSGAFWAWHLFTRFGNPVFPLANAIFNSPDFPGISVGLDRFAAHTPWDALTLPFRMLRVSSGIYAEIMVPDIRLACILILVVGLISWRLWLHMKAPASAQETGFSPDGAVSLVVSFTAIAYLTWVYSSGNGRYFLPVLLLTGPLLVWITTLALQRPKWSVLFLCSILVLQLIHGGTAGYRRWDSASWTQKWLNVDVPARLIQTPHDYLMIGAGEDTFISAYLHPGSRHVLLGGKNPRSPREPGADRLHRFIDRGITSGRLRMLIRETETRNSELYLANKADELTILLANADLAPWNLKTSSNDCAYIGIDLAPVGVQVSAPNVSLQNAWPKHYSILSCAVEAGTEMPADFFRTLAALESVSKQLTNYCPQVFPAPASLPVFLYESWGVRYPGSDVILIYKDGQLAYSRFPFGPFSQSLGELSAWTEGRGSMLCKRLPRR